MNEQLEPNPEIPLFDAMHPFRWWERMRWIYNLAVGLSGAAVCVAYSERFQVEDLLGAGLYGLIANAFYCLGSWLELANHHYLNDFLRPQYFRTALFVIATMGSMWLTFISALVYFDPIFWP